MSQTTRDLMALSADDLEYSKVLSCFLELLRNEGTQSKLFWAPNSVVDWFGRTVRGPHKIHEYIKSEVHTQYEHMGFEKAERCDPIEVKPTHMKTKILSTQEIDYVRPLNKVTTNLLKNYPDSDAASDDDVDNDNNYNNNDNADNDDDDYDDDHEINVKQQQKQMKLFMRHEKTPERTNSSVIEELTPPSSTNKRDFTNAESDDEDALMEIKAKRIKLTRPTKPLPFSYLRRLAATTTTPITAAAIKTTTTTTTTVAAATTSSSSSSSPIPTSTTYSNKKRTIATTTTKTATATAAVATKSLAYFDDKIGVRSLLNDNYSSSDDNDDDVDNNDNDYEDDDDDEGFERKTPITSTLKMNYVAAYAPLRYLQTKGILRCIRSQNNDFDITNPWERHVRIRISYRKRLADDQLQFALVIYEHFIDGKKARSQTRRCLMTEFSEIATSAAATTANEIAASVAAAIDADDETSATSADEQPALVINDADETIVATVETPTTDEIAAALESAAFTIVPLRTPTKSTQTPPATPKRKPRSARVMTGVKRLNMLPSSSSSTPKRSSAARYLRL